MSVWRNIFANREPLPALQSFPDIVIRGASREAESSPEMKRAAERYYHEGPVVDISEGDGIERSPEIQQALDELRREPVEEPAKPIRVRIKKRLRR
jgi:hypothetical protein